MADPDRHPPVDPATLIGGYEALRLAVVVGRSGGWHLGHGLLAARGLAAWMTAWAVPAPAAPALGPPAAVAATTPSAALRSLPDAGPIVAVLSQMALAHVQPPPPDRRGSA